MGTVVLVNSSFEWIQFWRESEVQEERWNGVKQLVTPEKLLEDIWDTIKSLLSTRKQKCLQLFQLYQPQILLWLIQSTFSSVIINNYLWKSLKKRLFLKDELRWTVLILLPYFYISNMFQLHSLCWVLILVHLKGACS